jgi:hypothetical protein
MPKLHPIPANPAPGEPAGTPSPDEFLELLLGSWIGVALIAEALIRAGVVRRDELLLPLADAVALAKDRRVTSLAAMHKLISEGFGPTDHRRRLRRPCRRPA